VNGEGLFRFLLLNILTFLQVIKKTRHCCALREGWQRKSFVFFNLNLFQVLKIKIAANSRPKVARRNDDEQLQGHAQCHYVLAEIHKKKSAETYITRADLAN
jgi:hypothetical protein